MHARPAAHGRDRRLYLRLARLTRQGVLFHFLDFDPARERTTNPIESFNHQIRALLDSVVRFLGDSEAPALLLSLDDLWLEPNPQNIPGTPVDRPNWVQRSPRTLDELFGDDEVVAILRATQDCRLASYARAGGQP